MGSFAFSKSSLDKLEGVHPDLVAVVKEALKLSTVDFKVTEGVRTRERQQALYAQGRTAPGPVVTWTLNSKHIPDGSGYGKAVDLLPAPYDWKDREAFMAVGRAMMAAARSLKIRLRWGADWDGDDKLFERGETDLPHFELKD